MFALPAALIFRLFFGADFTGFFTFAHLALAAAEILALAAALIFRLRLGSAVFARGVLAPPRILFSSFCSSSTWSLRSAALRSCLDARSKILMPVIKAEKSIWSMEKMGRNQVF